MTREILSKAVAASLTASKPDTAYAHDCFVTSEVGHNDLLTRCRPVQPGGAYLGVGPCQNLTYMGALRPSCAIIIDGRIDNLLEHLIFKLVFERSRTPAEYLAFLFSRSLPAEVAADAGSLLAAFDDAPAPARLLEANWHALLAELQERWALPPDMIDRARRIYTEFHRRGLAITSVSEQQLATLDYIPDLRAVISSTAYTGESFHFLTSQERYDYVRDLQRSDRVIPVLGDITDPTCMSSVNGILGELGLRASTIYLSNMEEFLLHRYEIADSGISSRPNPQGLLAGSWRAAYGKLVSALQVIDTTPECLLIRFFFPGEDSSFQHGAFPWLVGNIMPLQNFLSRYEIEAPRSVFETYW